MAYKGYRAAVTYHAPVGVRPGEGVGLRDAIVFAAAAAELRWEFQLSIDDYLAVCAERGRAPAATGSEQGDFAVGGQ